MTMKSLPLLIIITFLGMAVFGFLGLSCYGKADCRMTVIPGMRNNVCSSLENPLALTAYHISCLENVSQSVIGSGSTFAAAPILLFLIFCLAFSDLFGRKIVGNHSFFNMGSVPAESSFKTKQKILRWLSFLEKRDPAEMLLRARSFSVI